MHMTNDEIRNRLIELMQKYPDAPIIGSVEEEIVTGDYSCYLASVSRVDYVEYAIWQDRYYDDEEELLDDWVDQNYEDFEELSDAELREVAKEDTEKLWEKAIMVHMTPYCG